MTPDIILAIASIHNYAEKVGKTPEVVYKEWCKFAYGRFSERKIMTPNIENVNEDDVNEIYSKYPNTDPANNDRSTRKGAKTKQTIRRLLSRGISKDVILKAIDEELAQNAKGTWLRNAETFFNNLPEADTPIQREIQIDQTWQ